MCIQKRGSHILESQMQKFTSQKIINRKNELDRSNSVFKGKLNELKIIL